MALSPRPVPLRPAMRRSRIAEIVMMRGKADVVALSVRFNASVETIRRDLLLLDKAGLLRRVHGGARAIEVRGEGGFGVRMRRNAAGKRRIAETLLTQVVPGQTLFLDTGSTTLICAQALARVRKLTVVTNSTAIAEVLAKGEGRAEVYLLGGRFGGDNMQTTGAGALGDLAQYQADIAVLTVGALGPAGAADFSRAEADLARAMIGAAGRLFVVVDHTKFLQSAPFVISPLAQIDAVICDQPPKKPLREALEAAGVAVFC